MGNIFNHDVEEIEGAEEVFDRIREYFKLDKDGVIFISMASFQHNKVVVEHSTVRDMMSTHLAAIVTRLLEELAELMREDGSQVAIELASGCDRARRALIGKVTEPDDPDTHG